MTDHKFEPGQLVLVRNSDGHKWRLRHYSHFRNSADEHFFATIGEYDFRYCLPFNDETKHLQNTTQPYEPPKPPQEYEWGQKVEVFKRGERDKGLYIGCVPISQLHRVYTDKHGDGLFAYTEIRPLPDDTAHLDAKP